MHNDIKTSNKKTFFSIRSVTLMVLYLDSACQCRLHNYTRCPGHTSVYLCAALLQNITVLHYFYSRLSVPLEWSCWPHIRWCGTGGLQEQGQCYFIGLSCSIPTIVFYYFSLSLLSLYWLVLCGWGLQTDRVYITLSQPCTADLFK